MHEGGGIVGNAADAVTGRASTRLLPLVITLFFAWGFCTVLVDVLIPKLKATFSLSYAEAMLTQFCFFLAYFIVSIPAGLLISRIGYLRGIVLGLLIMAGGCLMFSPAASMGWYPAFLAALFVLAAGITIVQVAANPLAAGLGDPARAHSRLTLAQAFNSVGTMIGPLFGSAMILAAGVAEPEAGLSAAALEAFRVEQASHVRLPYMIIAAVLVLLAAVCWWVRRSPMPSVRPVGHGDYFRLLGHPRLSLGALSIFLYVGAEVAIGSALVNYLIMVGATTSEHAAGNLISVYWGLAMVGRFIGSYVLRFVAPGVVLTVCAVSAGCLGLLAGVVLEGLPAAVAILSIGLFNSVMFPTIFTMSIDGLGEDTAGGSGILCLAIVGGAVVPLLTGVVADQVGLALALLVPVACYACIAGYGLLVRMGWLESRGKQAAAPGQVP
ncbi:sugar MFS transporter [Pseudoxanthomonas wuyuanensis]|uniref:MFS transporter, FHS family, L-fucose permease n=1 Tax=Pseudoxanthomonas wuyuanensis TaxID=1073196 RepID=A0A286D3U9_9GAMM|nr:sugar MFS transporter [Pseudoxanthomonas wuyuanensis]KAF1719419.1 sugar MFS transporter [Pseudoxanthomonas wuyuanensis]SOD53317.1 MFS transporter, FHS family, L-fucose permease [Pseudoxanthomonas wuyuanensis]